MLCFCFVFLRLMYSILPVSLDCVVFLFCFSSSYVPYVASFPGLCCVFVLFFTVFAFQPFSIKFVSLSHGKDISYRLMEQELLTLPENPSASPFSSGLEIRTDCSIFSFLYSVLSNFICLFVFFLTIVVLSFWLSCWCLQTFLIELCTQCLHVYISMLLTSITLVQLI
jgi:hypothetical protein